MTVKPLTEQHLEFLSLKGGCTGFPETTHVKMPNCWKSHVMVHLKFVCCIGNSHDYHMGSYDRKTCIDSHDCLSCYEKMRENVSRDM